MRSANGGAKYLILELQYKSYNIRDYNSRGEALLEYLSGTNMDFFNRRREPTFRNRSREEVIDVTLASGSIWERIGDWSVSGEV